MAAHNGTSLLWSFDRLIDCDPERLHSKVLLDTLLPLVANSIEELPDRVQARLALRLLEDDMAAGRIDDVTLDYLLTLATCELEGIDADFLAPLPALILAVRRQECTAPASGGLALHAWRVRARYPAAALYRWCRQPAWAAPAAALHACLLPCPACR